MVKCDIARAPLRQCLDAIRDGEYGQLVKRIGELTPLMALMYVTPGRNDIRGMRAADRGAGDVLIAVRQLRASVAELPTHAGLGGVVFDGSWMIAMLDWFILLLER